ncbi:MAG: TetR/AcrR family transcriptional regulator [Chloroflexota bacterium]|nr:TetR/AcrR family transcriptional regulator [Chloroflexota bacterium]
MSATTAAPASEGRDRVLRQAHALFVERGFDGVSMQQVAAGAGLTKAALYYHFRDKEELFARVVQRELERIRLGLEAALGEEAPLRTHLERVAGQMFAIFHSDFGRLMGDLKEHVSIPCCEMIGFRPEPPYDILRPCLERAVAAGEIRADLDLDLVLSLFFGMIFHQIGPAKQGGAVPDRAVATAIVDVLLDGIATAPTRAR